MNQVSGLPQELQKITQVALENMNRLQELNAGAHSQSQIRQELQKVTGHAIDDSVEIRLPIYSDYGRNIQIGKNVFINSGVTLVDLGGIKIEDQALIGPNATIITVNHPLDPAKRRSVEPKPVTIGKNAWLGANSTILPGVTIGENAIVAAGAVVSHNVPANSVVAGVPARVIKNI